MLLYGASGHAKVIIDCLEASKVSIDGIFDDDLNKKYLLTYDVLGTYDDCLLRNKEIIISIGDNQIRKKKSNEIVHRFGKVVHPTAIIQQNVLIGEGSVIFHHAIIQSSTQIGNHVIVNTKASIDHDCIIENYVHIAPSATLCGGIMVGEGTLIGAGAIIIPNLSIGKWATVGAGAVVINNVPDYAVVLGNPAIIKKYNK